MAEQDRNEGAANAPAPGGGLAPLDVSGRVPHPYGDALWASAPRAARLDDPGRMAALGLPKGSRISVRPVHESDDPQWSRDGSDHGLPVSLEVQVEVPAEAGGPPEVHSARTGELRLQALDGSEATAPLLVPAPIHGNVVHWTNQELAVPPAYQPRPGIHLTSWPAPEGLGRDGLMREIAVLDGSGMGAAALILSEPADPSKGGQTEIRMRNARGSWDTADSPEQAEEWLRAGGPRRGAAGRRRRRGIPRADILLDRPGARADRGRVRDRLAQLREETGSPPRSAAAGPALAPEDLRVLLAAFREPVCWRPSRSILALANQEILLPSDTLSMEIAAPLREDLWRLTEGRSWDGPQETADVLARALSHPDVALRIEAAMAEWANGPGTVAVSDLAGFPMEATGSAVLGEDGEVVPSGSVRRASNPMAQAAQGHVAFVRADLASTHSRRSKRQDAGINVPRDFLGHLSPVPEGGASLGRVTVALARSAAAVERSGIRIPAVWLRDSVSGEVHPVPLEDIAGEPVRLGPGGPVLVDGSPLPEGDIRAGHVRWEHLDRTLLQSRSDSLNPFNCFAAPDRNGIACQQVQTTTHAEGPPPPIRVEEREIPGWSGPEGPGEGGAGPDGMPPSQAYPWVGFRVCALSGDEGVHEDAMRISDSAAAMVEVTMSSTQSLPRSPTDHPGLQHVGPGSPALQAEGIDWDAVAESCGVPRESLDAIGPDGMVRTGAEVRRGDPVQLSRLPAPGREPPWEWRAVRARAEGRVASVTSGTVPRHLGPDEDILVRVQIVSERELRTGDKLVLPGGSKYMAVRVPDSEMPVDGRGRTADIAVSDLSGVARNNYGDFLSLKLGRLAEAAGEIAAEELRGIDEALPEDPGTPLDAHPEAAARLERLFAGPLADMSVTLMRGAGGTLMADLPEEELAAGAAVYAEERSCPGLLEDARRAGWTAGALRDAVVRPLLKDAEGAARGIDYLRLRVPEGATREEIEGIESRLGPEAAERASDGLAVHADEADRLADRRMDRPADMGLVNVGVTILGLNIDRSVYAGYSPSPTTGAPSRSADGNTPGSTEIQLRYHLDGLPSALRELEARGDAAGFGRIAEAHAGGAAPEAGPLPEREAERHVRRLLRSACVDWDPASGELRPLPALRIREDSHGGLPRLGDAPTGGHAADGARMPGGLHDPGIFGESGGRDRFGHIELPVPILHPWQLEASGGGDLPLARLLDMDDRAFRRLARSEHGRGGAANGPDEIRTLLADLRRRATEDGPGLLQEARRRSGSGPGRSRQRARLRDLEALVADPGLRPQDWVLDAVPVAPSHMREGHQAWGSLERAQSGLDRAYAAIRAEASRLPEGVRDRWTTRNLHRAVKRLTDALGDETGGKDGAIAKSLYGGRATASMRATVLPAGPEVPITHVEISVIDGISLHARRIRHVLVERMGRSGEEADRMVAEADPLARRIARAVAAEAPMLVVRNPFLHRGGQIALEAKLHDRDDDRSIRVHPAILKSLGADHDGDALKAFAVLTAAASRELREHRALTKLIVKPGTGEPLLQAQHGARLGLVQEIREIRKAKGAEASVDWLLETALPDVGPQHPWHKKLHRALPPKETEEKSPGSILEAFEQELADLRDGTAADGEIVLAFGRMWTAGAARSRRLGGVCTEEGLRELEGLARKERARQLEADPEGPLSLCAEPLPPEATSEERVRRREDILARTKAEQEVVEELMERAREGQFEGHPAEPILLAAAEGCRLKASALTRLVLCRGAVVALGGELRSEFGGDGLMAGPDPRMEAGRQLQAWNANNNSYNKIGSCDFLTQKLRQVLYRMRITAKDCGDGRPVQAQAAALADPDGPFLQGEWINASATEKTLRAKDPKTGRRLSAKPGERVSPELMKALAAAEGEAGGSPGRRSGRSVRLRRRAEALPASPILEGATLAEAVPAADGRPALKAGAQLREEDLAGLAAEGAEVRVRHPSTCRVPEGVCAACAGVGRHLNGRPDRLGEPIGGHSAAELMEGVTQDVISAGKNPTPKVMRILLERFSELLEEERDWTGRIMEAERRAAGTRRSGASPRTHDPDAFDLEALFPGEEASPLKAARLAFRRAWLKREDAPLAAGTALARVFRELWAEHRAEGLDPRHFRNVAEGFLGAAREGEGLAGLYEAALDAGSGLPAANTSRPRRAVAQSAGAVGGRIPASDVVAPPKGAERQPERGVPEAVRMAMDDDAAGLRDLLEAKGGEALRERDGLGRSALLHARSPGAAAALVEAGLDPLEPWGPDGLTPIEAMAVRGDPAATLGTDAAGLHWRTMQAALAGASGPLPEIAEAVAAHRRSPPPREAAPARVPVWREEREEAGLAA